MDDYEDAARLSPLMYVHINRRGALIRAKDIQPGRAGYLLPDRVTVTSVTAQRV